MIPGRGSNSRALSGVLGPPGVSASGRLLGLLGGLALAGIIALDGSWNLSAATRADDPPPRRPAPASGGSGGSGTSRPEAEAGPGFRRWRLPKASGTATGFRSLDPARTGLRFTNALAEASAARNRILENGSGVGLGDVDGDGRPDVYLCSLEGTNALYLNRGGWRFEEAAQAAGVACGGQASTGCLMLDVDGDRDLDLLVNALGGGTRLFLNDARGRFTESTNSGFARRLGATSMAAADLTGDGLPEVYVGNYRTTTYRDGFDGARPSVRMVDGKPVATPASRFGATPVRGGGVMVNERGEVDILYRNKGGGSFGPVSWTAGAFLDAQGRSLAEPPLDWALSVAFRDLDGDLLPELYVCNDFVLSRDGFWRNTGGRGLQVYAPEAIRQIPMSSMGVDFADINRDGIDDFVVVDMLSRDPAARQRQRANHLTAFDWPLHDPAFRPEVSRNMLYLGRGDGTWAEIAQLAGVAASDWSWCPIFLDVDLDGFEDLLVGTGNDHDVLDADLLRQVRGRDGRDAAGDAVENLRRFPRLETPMAVLRNRGDLTFEDMRASWGLSSPGIRNGMALADLDLDGDLDLVVNRLQGPAELHENVGTAPRIAVRLRGLSPDTGGIGARIRLLGGPVPEQSQERMCGGRYLSCDEGLRVFAASAKGPMTLEVRWRSGRVSRLEGVEADCLYEVDESGAVASPAGATGPAPKPGGPTPNEPPLFTDASALLAHAHEDPPSDEFQLQPLLSRRLGEMGPALAWFDLEGDGDDDLVVGSGSGGLPVAFLGDGRGGFTRRAEPLLAAPLPLDTAGLLGLPTDGGGGARELVVGVSSLEDPGSQRPPAVVRALGTNGTVNGSAVAAPAAGGIVPEALSLEPGSTASTGPVAAGSVAGRPGLVLFVGGRSVPGRYPESADSGLWFREGGRWKPDLAAATAFRSVGLVGGAVFTDLDGDGSAELVLAREWDAPAVFSWTNGVPVDRTTAWGLGGLTGWWNSVQAGDWDGDGRMDLVLGNWGRNSRWQEHLAVHPARVHYGDADGDGRLELIEAFWHADSARWLPWRDAETVGRSFPGLAERLPTFRAYGQASVTDLLGDRAAAFRVREAASGESVVLLNRGGRFERRPLPVEAQMAPVFGIGVGDWDGDGREDLALAQNFFGVEPETSRFDAGRGLVLLGGGDGTFRPLEARRSGVLVWGEQRALAVADFDGDGRTDLALAQNRGPVRLFRNTAGRPGLRIRLEGPTGNPTAIGASLRLRAGPNGRPGPAREIHAGGGHWSQDSVVPVMAMPSVAAILEVAWPGGGRTESPVPAGAREVRVRRVGAAAELMVVR